MLYDPSVHDWITQMDEVEKTVFVTFNWKRRGETTVKIEAMRSLSPHGGGPYHTRSYVLQDVAPAAIKDPVHSVVAQAWVVYDAPWTNTNTADEAIRSAISFLSEIAERE